MCLSHSSSLRSGKSSRNCAPRDSLRSSAPITMHSATSSMYPSSIAPSTSWLKTVPRSSIAATDASSLSRRIVSCASVSPSCVRKTAHFSFIIVPSSSLISEIRRPPGSRPMISSIMRCSSASAAREAARRAHAGGALRGVLAGAAAEDQRVQQRVGAEPVAAVDGDAGDLARGVQAGDLGRAPDVGLDAAHDVVAAGLDVDRLARDVDAGEVAPDVDDLAQRLERALARHLGDVERDGAVGEAAALVDLGLLGAADDVARGELHLVRRVLLHEALALRRCRGARPRRARPR